MDREDMIERFVNFLNGYVNDKGKPVYVEQLLDVLTTKGSRSLRIDWTHLLAFDPELANELLENPEECILAAEDAIQIVLKGSPFFYTEPPSIHARFYGLFRPKLPRQTDSQDINRLIQVEGIITRISEVKPFVQRAVFVCKDCGNEMVRLQRPYENLVKPAKCDACGSRNVELDVEKSRFINFQSFRLQDPPEVLRGGEMPRHIDGIFLDDLADKVKPGDRVRITGILRVILEANGKKPTFKKILEVNDVELLNKDWDELDITDADIQKIREEAKRSDFKERMVHSIAPSIWGHEDVKEGLLLAMLGGVERILPDGTVQRGRIHILMIGDPSVSKSQFLQFLHKVAPRAVLTGGKGASSAGLTAAAVRDELSGEWALEAGAMVLADNGVALVDEFEKMRESDRESIHIAMEQGHVYINKAGINAVLPARATVIAASNPKFGYFNRHKSVAEQVAFDPPLLTRFDLIYVMLDEPDEKIDAAVAQHILDTYDVPDDGELRAPYTPEFLRKFIAYARKLRPHLTEEAKDLLKQYFVHLRKRYNISNDDTNDKRLPIAYRQLHALARLSIAHAKLHLREEVTVEDAKAAITLFEKVMRNVVVDEEGNLDIMVLEVGRSSSKLRRMEKLVDIIKALEPESEWGAPEDAVIENARQANLGTAQEIRELLRDLIDEGKIYQPRAKHYKVGEV